MATVRGTAVIFSYTTTAGMTITGLTGWLTQNADLENTADEYQVKSAQGKDVTEIIENPKKRLTVRYEASGSDRATAITNAALPALNTFVLITACVEFPEIVSNYWMLKSAKKSLGNTGTMGMDLTMVLNPEITT